MLQTRQRELIKCIHQYNLVQVTQHGFQAGALAVSCSRASRMRGAWRALLTRSRTAAGTFCRSGCIWRKLGIQASKRPAQVESVGYDVTLSLVHSAVVWCLNRGSRCAACDGQDTAVARGPASAAVATCMHRAAAPSYRITSNARLQCCLPAACASHCRRTATRFEDITVHAVPCVSADEHRVVFTSISSGLRGWSSSY